jgi:hypothetical protein
MDKKGIDLVIMPQIDQKVSKLHKLYCDEWLRTFQYFSLAIISSASNILKE